MASCLTIEDEGEARVIVLNRPEVRNAVNMALAVELAAALEELDADPRLRVGVIAGSAPDFCTGMDLRAYLIDGVPIVPGSGFGGIVERKRTKPLIAAIEGNALAGGLEIALACDLRVIARGARLGLPEVSRGIVAGAGGLWRLPRMLPYDVAMCMAVTGKVLDGESAAGYGLGTLAEDGAALSDAVALARQIGAHAPLAVAASRAVVEKSHDWSLDESWRAQTEFTDPVFASSDAQEGAWAFAEKRAPVWTGN